MSLQTKTGRRRVLPGLTCNSVEMFLAEGQLMTLSGGNVKSFKELPYQYVELIREAINAKPEVEAELRRMHPDSEMKRIEQFAICNFSGLDYHPDIKDNVLQEGEYWDCPMRGLCTGEGKICRPLKYNDSIITGQDIRLMKLLATDMTNETIAAELILSLGTFHLCKKLLYQKLNVATKQELTVIALQLNII